MAFDQLPQRFGLEYTGANDTIDAIEPQQALDRPLVKISFSVESYSSPKKAKGAISAPTLVPVTKSKRGLLPLSDQPLKNPAP